MSEQDWLGLMLGRHLNRSVDYFHETTGWTSSVSSVSPSSQDKCLPYVRSARYDRVSYERLVLLGNYLYRCSDIIQRAIQRFTSYVVSNGHQYEVNKRTYPLPGAGRASASKARLNRIRGIVDYTMENCFPLGWQKLQEETLMRYLREGCAFRRMFRDKGGLQVRFVEPRTVRGPEDLTIWENKFFNFDGVEVRALSHRLGVFDTPKDHTLPLGYTIYDKVEPDDEDPENYKPVNAKDMQHARQGIDSTDPRGLPIFWNAMEYVQRHKDTGLSSAALSKVRASYAVIRQYAIGTNFQNILKVANTHRETEAKRGGDVMPGKEVEAKGFEYMFPELNIDAEGFNQLLNAYELAIGAYLDMPEWMITGEDAGGGSSGVVASEGPFDRRVKRDQTGMALLDVELLWNAIAVKEGLVGKELEQYKALISITPVFPTVPTRDPLKESQRVIAELHAGLQSPQGACGELRHDYDAVMEQLSEHNKTYADHKIISKWDPETQVQRNKGDNTRVNRMGPKSSGGGG